MEQWPTSQNLQVQNSTRNLCIWYRVGLGWGQIQNAVAECWVLKGLNGSHNLQTSYMEILHLFSSSGHVMGLTHTGNRHVGDWSCCGEVLPLKAKATEFKSQCTPFSSYSVCFSVSVFVIFLPSVPNQVSQTVCWW